MRTRPSTMTYIEAPGSPSRKTYLPRATRSASQTSASFLSWAWLNPSNSGTRKSRSRFMAFVGPS